MSERVAVTSGLFTAAGESGRLIGGHCPVCARCHFPRLETCPYCSAAGCTERLLGERGTLRLFTSVRNRPPGYRGEVPFGFGVVELAEGIRLIGRLTEPDVGRLRVGQPMVVVFTTLHLDEQGREVVSYAFAPDGA